MVDTELQKGTEGTERTKAAHGADVVALSVWEAGVLDHTSSNGRYVTDEQRVIDLAKAGLLFDHGAQRLAGGMHYLTLTMKGRQALSAWRAAQPRPKTVKRRRSRQFDDWMNYCDAFGSIPFGEFLKTVWPARYQYA